MIHVNEIKPGNGTLCIQTSDASLGAESPPESALIHCQLSKARCELDMRKSAFVLGVPALALGTLLIISQANAADAAGHLQPLQEFKIAHCCHPHPYSPYDDYCCHPSTAYAAPRAYVAPRAYGVGPASVRGVSRRTSRRVSRRR